MKQRHDLYRVAATVVYVTYLVLTFWLGWSIAEWVRT